MTDNPPPGKSRLADAMNRLPDAQRERASHVTKAMRASDAAPSLKLEMTDGTLVIGFEGESPEVAALLQMADIGTTDRDFYAGLLSQISCLGSQKRSIDSAMPAMPNRQSREPHYPARFRCLGKGHP